LTGEAGFMWQYDRTLLEKALAGQGAVVSEQHFQLFRQRRILSAEAG
jgi:hypothetical protein